MSPSNRLAAIPIVTDAGATAPEGLPTGNLAPVLHEIRHALVALIETGAVHVIDLAAMPFAPGEEDRLREILGGGEVSATLNVLGCSTVKETAIAGVWWVEHHNALGESLGKTLEITRMPEILFSQPEDLRATLADLDRRMAAMGD